MRRNPVPADVAYVHLMCMRLTADGMISPSGFEGIIARKYVMRKSLRAVRAVATWVDKNGTLMAAEVPV